MRKLSSLLKAVAVGTSTFLSVSVLPISNAFAQDNQKPISPTQKPAPQTEQMSSCGCCKKKMDQMMNDSMNKIPGMNHAAPGKK